MYGEAKDASQRKTYQLYFKLVMVFGVILVSGSVFWWMKSPPLLYKFEGRIEKLHITEDIYSEEIYFKRHPRGTSGLLRDESFMIVNEKPYSKGDQFTIYYRKDGKDQEDPMVITYDPNHKPHYLVEYEATTNKYRLTPIIAAAPPHALIPSPSLFGTSAYAADEVQQATRLVSAATPANSPMELVLTLQDGASLVGQKIMALDRLGKLTDAQIQEFLRGEGKEPMIVTLADLARHSDKELATKASRLLYDRTDLNSVIEERLKKTAEAHDNGLKILYRLDRVKAEKILDHLATTGVEPANLAAVKAELTSGKNNLALVPTGTKQGDRYYVKAEWDPANGQTVANLSALFNDATTQDRTKPEEARLMQGRHERWIYSYDKDWSFGFARQIEACGAKASFVDGSNL